jgi:hypothetical protein
VDKEFIEKLNSVSVWKKLEEKSDQAEFSASFSKDEDGLVRISSAKGNFIYKLKQLNELFSPEKSETVDIRWEDPQYMTLLYSIESAVKRIYEDNPELTDSSVILALESLALKPENVNNDVIVKAINRELRLQLSMSDYSRNEVKRAIRKILNSARRHNKVGGIRGYLDFIFEHVP